MAFEADKGVTLLRASKYFSVFARVIRRKGKFSGVLVPVLVAVKVFGMADCGE